MSLVSGFVAAYAAPDAFASGGFYGQAAGASASATTTPVTGGGVNGGLDYGGSAGGQHFIPAPWTWTPAGGGPSSGGGGGGGGGGIGVGVGTPTAAPEFSSPPLSCYSGGTSPYSSPCHYGAGGNDFGFGGVAVGAGVHGASASALDPQGQHPLHGLHGQHGQHQGQHGHQHGHHHHHLHHHHHHAAYALMDAGVDLAGAGVDGVGVPRVRVIKRRNTANKKERRRTQSINNAFTELRDCIPNVPADTKLSKIKTLRLATSYISYLMAVLDAGDAPADVPFRAELGRSSKADR